jgi:hypothetical protein
VAAADAEEIRMERIRRTPVGAAMREPSLSAQ